MSHRNAERRRVVITGLGLVSPLGNTPTQFWESLRARESGVAPCQHLPASDCPLKYAGEARDFQGEIGDFGDMPKDRQKTIRKALKVMCRETQMAVAAAQLALADAGLGDSVPEPDMSGVVIGSDYMLTVPEDYAAGIRKCGGYEHEFQFQRWGQEGLGEMAPLWMLKYLPNMPASHIAILNDLRGPNNSLTMRESSGNLAIGEAFRTIRRGHANRMVAGATGTRILPLQALHAMQSEQMADPNLPPHQASRPFDNNRTGMVAGEGAGVVILEELEAAVARGASIYGEVLGAGSSNVADDQLRGVCDTALANALRAALRDAELEPASIGHINAHGLGTSQLDVQECRAFFSALGEAASTIPVVALKSYFGNLGAGSSVVEFIGSLLALRHAQLPPVLNYETPDPACAIVAVTDEATSPGRSFAKLSVTPQGQAAALVVAEFKS